MTRFGTIVILLFIVLIGIGVWYTVTVNTGSTLTLAQAKAFAQNSECTQKGTLGANGTYNPNSKTWWIDFTPATQYAQSGCNPACVVSEASSTAEINWRCTGSVVPASKDDLIKLYYYNPALDQGPGGAQCSRNGLVAVERVIPKTTTPLADSVKLLLRGEITAKERADGTQSEFPLPGVALRSATITDGVATLTFDDPQNKTGGGSCRVGILWAQIEATAKQFPTVQSARFMPEELFQP